MHWLAQIIEAILRVLLPEVKKQMRERSGEGQRKPGLREWWRDKIREKWEDQNGREEDDAGSV